VRKVPKCYDYQKIERMTFAMEAWTIQDRYKELLTQLEDCKDQLLDANNQIVELQDFISILQSQKQVGTSSVRKSSYEREYFEIKNSEAYKIGLLLLKLFKALIPFNSQFALMLQSKAKSAYRKLI
jgi:hypothetical protein